jgi:hypothetical protein
LTDAGISPSAGGWFGSGSPRLAVPAARSIACPSRSDDGE